MNIVIAIIGLFFIVLAALFMLFRTQKLHAELCAKDHVEEIITTINTFKTNLNTPENNEHQEDLRNVDQKRRQVIGHTSKKMIITYLMSSTPNKEIIHSFSMSWYNKKIPIKSATFLATTIIYALNLTENWNKELRLSLKKSQVFHFRAKLSIDENKNYFHGTTLSLEDIQKQEDVIRDMSLDVQVERKQDISAESA